MPGRDGPCFLSGESGKQQLRESRLPRQRLGFVNGEFKQVRVLLQARAEFGDNFLFGILDLRQDLLARVEADLGDWVWKFELKFGAWLFSFL